MQKTGSGEERWEPLARAFLRGVEDGFLLSEFREALGVTGVKAPRDDLLARWLRDRGWDNHRKDPFGSVKWTRRSGCLDAPRRASIKS